MRHRKKTLTTQVPPQEDVCISLSITHENGEVLVSEQAFHIHATGATKDEALANFWQVFYGYEEVLEQDRHELGPRLIAQLDYIQRVKAWMEQLEVAKAQREQERMEVA